MSTCVNTFSNLPSTWRYSFGAINVVVAGMALFGNLLIAILMLKIRSFRSRSAVILGSLATIDLLVGFVIAPMHILQLFSQTFTENCSLNNVRRLIGAWLTGASVASIALITYDRYLYLSKTQNYIQHMTRRKTGFLICLCWIVPALLPLANLAGKQFYGAIIFVYCTSIFIIMLISYRKVIQIVRESEKQIAQFKLSQEVHQSKQYQRQNKMQHWQSKRHVQAAKMALTIIVCFLICVSPLAIYMGLVATEAFVPDGISGFQGATKEIFYTFSVTIGMANSGFNPLIYYLKVPQFRQAFRKMSRRMIFPTNSSRL